jgi:hypothetical protein
MDATGIDVLLESCPAVFIEFWIVLKSIYMEKGLIG